MFKMKKAIAILALFIFYSNLSFAQDDKAYAETLKTMFEVSGSEGAYNVAITQMFGMFKQQYNSVDEKTWKELEEEFQNSSITDLVDSLVPVYKKHLTLKDLKELIKFYQTPIGKKYADKTPMIAQESLLAGQEWGMKIGQKFAEKMREKGY